MAGARPRGPRRERNEVWYFAEKQLGAVRIGDWKYRFIDQPSGWLGGTVLVDVPIITNLRLDPFERAGIQQAPPNFLGFLGHEFWRNVFVQQEVAKLGQTLIDFPPMQKGANFNIEGVKEQVAAGIRKSRASERTHFSSCSSRGNSRRARRTNPAASDGRETIPRKSS